jgi:uncharacterized protein
MNAKLLFPMILAASISAGGFAAVPPGKSAPGKTAAAQGPAVPDAASAARKKALARLSPYVQDSGSTAKKDVPLHAHIAVIARSMGDSVVLRWAPSKPGGWLYGNKNGYIVERARLSESAPSRPVFEALTQVPLKPLSLEEWKKRSSPDDHLSAIAAQVLYGKQMVTKAAYGKNDLSYLKFASEELENRWGFGLFAADNSAHVAVGMGLRFVDKNVKAGEKLIYRVFTPRGDTAYHLDTGAVFVEVTGAAPVEPPDGFSADGGEKRIMLTWSSTLPERFSGYYLERSDDNGSQWRRLTAVPLVSVKNHAGNGDNMHYTDTAVVNYRPYRYRLTAVTPFAETSRPVELEAFGRDMTPPPPPHIAKPKRVGEHKVKLSWDMPSVPPDLHGFIVTRSENPVRFFHPLEEKQLPKGAHEFIDTAATPMEPYYIVSAVDTAGNIAPSLPAYIVMRDSVPPAVPTGLAATIDTLGVVRLHWHPNPDSARLLGYRLMWANDPRHEFSQVTSEVIRDTAYVDTVSVNTLTRSVYFKLAALNRWYVPSKPTQILEVRRPHVIKPVTPAIIAVDVTDSTVRLHWAKSPSAMIDRQVIERRRQGDTSWAIQVALGPSDSTWTDLKVNRTVTYEYVISVHDSGGLASPRSRAMQARPYDTGVLPQVGNFKAKYNGKARAVELSWSWPTPVPDAWFVIYRGVGKAGLTEYQSVDAGKTAFTDASVPKATEVRYAVRCETRSGSKSPLSKTASVNVR